jgi:hypothetical protein
LPLAKHSQYNFRQRDFLQLHGCVGAACDADPPVTISNSAIARAALILAACDTRELLLEPSARPLPPRRLLRFPASVPGVFFFDTRLLFAEVVFFCDV